MIAAPPADQPPFITAVVRELLSDFPDLLDVNALVAWGPITSIMSGPPRGLARPEGGSHKADDRQGQCTQHFRRGMLLKNEPSSARHVWVKRVRPRLRGGQSERRQGHHRVRHAALAQPGAVRGSHLRQREGHEHRLGDVATLRHTDTPERIDIVLVNGDPNPERPDLPMYGAG
jgi:hypothetical protein